MSGGRRRRWGRGVAISAACATIVALLLMLSEPAFLVVTRSWMGLTPLVFLALLETRRRGVSRQPGAARRVDWALGGVAAATGLLFAGVLAAVIAVAFRFQAFD